jgi:hypothetical protein
MSTHAIIAIPTETGFRGRFVHYDGYPENMMPAIQRIIDQNRKVGYTFQDAKNYLLNNHWSGIYKTEQAPANANSHTQVWYTETNSIDHEFLYILDDNEVTCYMPVGNEYIALDTTKTLKCKVAF